MSAGFALNYDRPSPESRLTGGSKLRLSTRPANATHRESRTQTLTQFSDEASTSTVPIAVFSTSHTLIFANQSFATMCGADHVSELECDHPKISQLTDMLLENGSHAKSQTGVSLSVLPMDGTIDVLLRGSELRLALSEFERPTRFFVLSGMTSPWTRRVETCLRDNFDLTDAEIDIVAGVYAGPSLQSLATSRGRSIRTVRTQLSSIYSKLGLKTQADLVRLVSNLVFNL